MFFWHGSGAFRALECNEAQEQADPSANTWADWADVNQPLHSLHDSLKNLPVCNKNYPYPIPARRNLSLTFKMILLSMQDTLLDTLREEPDHQSSQASDAQSDEDAAGHEDCCEGCLV